MCGQTCSFHSPSHPFTGVTGWLFFLPSSFSPQIRLQLQCHQYRPRHSTLLPFLCSLPSSPSFPPSIFSLNDPLHLQLLRDMSFPCHVSNWYKTVTEQSDGYVDDYLTVSTENQTLYRTSWIRFAAYENVTVKKLIDITFLNCLR